MFVKKLTYEDFNGNQVTKEFRFALNAAEVVEIQVENQGGLSAYLEEILAAGDNKAIVAIIKKLILLSYGVKSADGSRFEKSEEISKAFEQSPAYPILFTEFATDADKAATFVNGIIPPKEALEAFITVAEKNKASG